MLEYIFINMPHWVPESNVLLHNFPFFSKIVKQAITLIGGLLNNKDGNSSVCFCLFNKQTYIGLNPFFFSQS